MDVNLQNKPFDPKNWVVKHWKEKDKEWVVQKFVQPKFIKYFWNEFNAIIEIPPH